MTPFDPDTDLERPRAAPAFKASLRQQLLAEHAEVTAAPAPFARRWRWLLSLPAVAALVLAVFVGSTFGPALSSEQFLQRAYAAALELKTHGRIEYSKQRQLNVTDPSFGSLGKMDSYPSNTAMIMEDWYLVNDDKSSWFRDRRSLDDGTVIHDRLTHYTDPEMLSWDRIWMRLEPEDRVGLPICVFGLFAENYVDDWTDEEKKALSAGMPGGSEEGADIYFQLYERDPVLRLKALTELQKRGELQDLGLSTASGQTIRTFRMPIATTSYDEKGNAVIYPETMAIILTFDSTDYRMLKKEHYNVNDDKTLGSLLERTEYLDQQSIAEPQESFFNPARYGLMDPWSLLPSPQSDFENGTAPEGCYVDGTFLGNEPLVVLDTLGEEAYGRQLSLQFDNRPLNALKKK